MKILHRDTLWLKISPKISLQNGVNMTSSLTKIIIIWNSICDQMDDVFLSAGQNSYYRHRPENELSRPEVNSRFLLGRGALALKASIFESWPRVWEAFFSLWRIEFSFFFKSVLVQLRLHLCKFPPLKSIILFVELFLTCDKNVQIHGHSYHGLTRDNNVQIRIFLSWVWTFLSWV